MIITINELIIIGNNNNILLLLLLLSLLLLLIIGLLKSSRHSVACRGSSVKFVPMTKAIRSVGK